MTLVVGRATGLRVGNWGRSGNSVQVQGWFTGTSVYDLDARRQQLLGTADNPDEGVFPVTWTVDSSVNGFYRVRGAQVGRIGTERDLRAAFALDLERIGGYAAPWFEKLVQTVVRTNSHSITATSGVVAALAVPSGDSQYDLPTVRGYTMSTRTLDTGDALNVYKAAAPCAPVFIRFATSPAEFYTGAATIELKLGSSWYPVVGRQVAVTASTVWRISNGLVRLTSADGATAGTFEMWDNTAGAWESQSIQHAYATNFGVSAYLAAAAGAIGQGPLGSTAVLSVLRNSPEEVVVMCAGTDESATWRLQRGSYNVECSVATYASTTCGGLGVGYTSSVGLTAFTSGVWRTTADANGNGLTFTSGSTVLDTRTGRIVWTPTSTVSFAVGANLGSTSASVAALCRDEYLSALSWQQWVVAR